jgi:hypothetical protein
MYDLRQRLGIAISISTIGFGPITSALAKPQPLASVVSSEPTANAPKNHSSSATPLDAVLANVRPTKVPPHQVKRPHDRQAKDRSNPVHNSGRPIAKAKDRSLEGISHLTDNDRDRQKVNVSAVDRLIK